MNTVIKHGDNIIEQPLHNNHRYTDNGSPVSLNSLICGKNRVANVSISDPLRRQRCQIFTHFLRPPFNTDTYNCMNAGGCRFKVT